MAKGDQFKTLYRSDVSSKYAIANDFMPGELLELSKAIKLMEDKSNMGIRLTIAWLTFHTMFFAKFTKDYKSLKESLNECRKLRTEWELKKQDNKFPSTLKDKLLDICEKWFTAYHDSGAGISGFVYVPRHTQVKNAIRNL